VVIVLIRLRSPEINAIQVLADTGQGPPERHGQTQKFEPLRPEGAKILSYACA